MTLDTDVPADASPAVCERCGRPLPDADLLALHRALDHYDDLDDAERDAYEAAYRAESAAIRRFRIKALGTLVLLYFGFLFTYSIVS